MADSQPPNVPYFNGINFNSQFFSTIDGGLTYADAVKYFLTYPSAQGNWNSNYTMTLNGTLNQNGVANFNNDVNVNGDINFNGEIVLGTRLYQNLNSNWDAVDGYYGLAKDAYPLPNKSTSGIKGVSTWTSRTTNTNQWFGMCWSPQLGIFASTSITSAGTNKIMTSPDGVNWTLRTTPANTHIYRNIAWSPQLNLFVAVGASSTTDDPVLISSDGITWTNVLVPNNANWYGIVWSPELNLFVATADFADTSTVSIMTSPDGTNWTNRTVPVSGYSLRDICWSAELGLFITVASGGGTTQRVLKSTDGITWSVVDTPASKQYFAVCWSKELGLFVALSIDNTTTDIITSTDGDNWTLGTLPVGNLWRSVVWSRQLGIFLACGSGPSNSIISSPDGINWTVRTAPTGNQYRTVSWSPELGIFSVVSQAGTTSSVITSSFKGRPPTSYNVFDSPYNAIDENGDWILKAKSVFSDQAISILSNQNISINPLTAVNLNNKNLSNVSSLFFNNNSVANMILRYLDATSELSFTTTKTAGKYNFNSYNGTSDVSLLELQQFSIIPKVNVDMPANVNLTQATGTGVITQADPTSGSLLVNRLRPTFILSNYGASSAVPTAVDYDIANGRGLNYVVNAPAGSYNSIVGANDAIIVTRFRPAGESIGLSLCTTNSPANGIRISSANTASAQITLRTDTSTIVMSNTATNPISVNDRIYMGGTTTSTRRVDNVSVLNLFDTSNTNGRLEVLVDSPTQQVQYRSITNAFYHTFYVTNTSSITNARFTIADGNVATIGTNFHVRSSTTTTRLEFNTDVSGVTDFLGTNSSSLDSTINVKLRNNAGAVITTQVFTPTLITENVPTNTTSVTPTLSSQNGFVNSNVYTSGTITSGTTIGNYFSITLPDVGTYSITANRQLTNSDGSTITINQIYTGFSNNTTALYMPSSGSFYATSSQRQYGFTITALTDLPDGSTNMILRTNASNTTIYFNGFISHTATNLTMSVLTTWTKIY